jgi:DegV family protein with EDD domain
MTLLTLDNTAIVADSTCDPPSGFFDREGMALVPLKVHFGDETYRDLIDLSPAEFYARLRESAVMPTTSQPTAAEFEACYRDLRERYEYVFSLHLSRHLSGTYEAAAGVAETMTNVFVYDTRLVSSVVALAIERMRVRLEAGIDLAEMQAFVADLHRRSGIVFQVATLEYLRRGGRIGRASAMVGNILGIRPVLQVKDGYVDAYAKVRGEKRSLATMVEYLEQRCTPDDDVYLGVFHADAADMMAPLKERLLAARPRAHVVFESAVGAVVGTHAGPGTFAFCMFVDEG